MCWRSKNAVKQVAKEDIKTFKVGMKMGDNYFKSYYFTHLYKPLQKYETEMCVLDTKEDGFAITHGFHSYDPEFCKISLGKIVIGKCWDVFYVNKETMKLLNWYTDFLCKLLVAECIIPKGTTYYENEHGEIVSEAIIIKQLKPIEEWN